MQRLKAHISLLLIVLTVGLISWQTATVVYFYANQDEIEEEFCINKDKPELNCHGQCHLKEELQTSKPEVQKEPKMLEVRSLLVFQYVGQSQIVLPLIIKAEASHFDLDVMRELSGFCDPILDPPELS